MNIQKEMYSWQPKMVLWVRSRLGDDAMFPHERGMRFLEEALELAQAVGLTEVEIDKVKAHVYAKSVGRVEQEIGGVVSTLLTLAQAHGVSMNEAALAEIDRIHKLPKEKFRKRQELNAELGIGAPISGGDK